MARNGQWVMPTPEVRDEDEAVVDVYDRELGDEFDAQDTTERYLQEMGAAFDE